MTEVSGGATAGDVCSGETGASTATSVAGVRVTDLSAVGGAPLWTGLVTVGVFDEVERALALAPLVIVPLGLGLAISRMVSLHGSLNAYGFALLGVVGWRLVRDPFDGGGRHRDG